MQISKKQKKAIEKYRKEMMKRTKVFQKEIKPISELRNKILEELKTCKLCQNKKYKFIPCKAHEKAMMETSEKVMKIQFHYKLKLDLFPIPQPQIQIQMPHVHGSSCKHK